VKRKIESRLNSSDKLDKILTNRFLGPLLMIAILYGMYSFTFWASEMPILWLEGMFDSLKSSVISVVPPGILQSLIISGIIGGAGGVLGFVPLIMFMFFAIAVMEDSGYMARVAYMLDRLLRWFGLHGNSVMALVVSGGISGGCAVPGVMATRVLRDPKERIATLLVVPFMNCGAKLPVYALLIGPFFSKDKARMMFLLTLLSWAFALFCRQDHQIYHPEGAKDTLCDGASPLPGAHHRWAIDSYMGKDLAIYQKGRDGYLSVFRSPVGDDDLPGTHQRPGNLL